eukprot:scaffold609_cov170-Amphora_coffeaeformis.AAC.39
MSRADTLFPLNCPTSTCHFNVCLDCIKNMQKSEADGYTEASDGSRQVKFHVKCPSCREKYVSEKHPKHSSVPYVVTLREAYEMQHLLEEADSSLSARDLRKKYDFLNNTTLSTLQEAALNLNNYWAEINKPGDIDLELSKFESLPRSLQSTRKLDSKPWRDASLFQGLEELMTASEQEFLTQLFCSGQADSLAQAAHIMQGMILSTAERQAQAAVKDLGSFTAIERKEITQMRARFPLPVHMPRCVQLPVFDPTANHRLLKFDPKKNDLALTQIRGPAGRSGLRRGDVVTHIQSEAVESREDYVRTVKQMFEEDPNGVIVVVVNANEETAKGLKERMLKMRSTLKK